MCDKDELMDMWDGWCWNYEIGVPCTLEKGHEGSHVWDADRWDRYMRVYHATRLPDSEFFGKKTA